MSLSSTIDDRYRLKPHDLGRQERVVTIQNVSRQGLEQLAPVLHLHEYAEKRLLLEPVNCRELIAITGTANQAEWIGHQILLAAQSDRDQLRIHLFSPQTPSSTSRHRGAPRSAVPLPENFRTSLLLLLLLCFIFIVALVLNDNSPFWQWLGM